MTEQQYLRISAPFRTPMRKKALNLTNRLATGAVYAAYSGLCLYLALTRDARLIAVLLICGVPFVLLSFYRKKVNSPRPYEVWNIEPLIPKNTRGKSFPSRHVFSAFVIALTAGAICLPLGAVIAALALLLMALRVIGGVHFPKDVIAGALAGILCGGIGLAIWQMIGGIA